MDNTINDNSWTKELLVMDQQPYNDDPTWDPMGFDIHEHDIPNPANDPAWEPQTKKRYVFSILYISIDSHKSIVSR